MVNGNWLSQENENLEKLAQKLKVSPLMSFFSRTPDDVAFLADEMGEGIANIPAENTKEVWFPAEEGFKTVRALMQNVQTLKPSVSSQVLGDLRDFERVLEAANTAKVNWHLAVDY